MYFFFVFFLCFSDICCSGLKSYLQHIKIEDYDVDELKLIWEKELKDRDFKCEERVTSAVMLKLGKIVGTKQFGNARAVCAEVMLVCLSLFRWPSWKCTDGVLLKVRLDTLRKG